MILSNPTNNPNLDRKAIITLGDSLGMFSENSKMLIYFIIVNVSFILISGSRGRLFASQFCYITAQVEFSMYSPDAKLVLLGSSANLEFSKFATSKAVMLSLCYEYGLKLHRMSISIPTLQVKLQTRM